MPKRTRSITRAYSRNLARQSARARGFIPRYEPARDQSCTIHHRQLPCARCPETAREQQ